MGKVFFGAKDAPDQITVSNLVKETVVSTPEPLVERIEVPVEVIREVIVEVIKEVQIEVIKEIVKEVKVPYEVIKEKTVFIDRPYEVTVVKEHIIHDIQGTLEEKQKNYKLEKSNKKLKLACAILTLLVIALGVTHV